MFSVRALVNHYIDRVIAQIKRIILLFWIFCLLGQAVLSQHTSKNNYTGDWETAASWSPVWPVPQTNITSGSDITINGYITLNGSLSFSSLPSNLIINDTLIIKGDLFLENNNDLTINDNGILIVRGNLTINNQTINTANGYFIVTGNIIKTGSLNQGSLTSNDNPVRVFIGGTISPPELTDNPNFPALNCASPSTTPYPNSTCSYGNMIDIINDPIYTFFQSTCTIATPTITAGGPTTFCAGGSVTLTSSPGTTYLWSNGATTQSINVTTAGSYTVRVKNAIGCQSAPSVATIVTVNALPAMPTITAGGPTTFCAGGNVTLTSGAGSTYLWSTGATTASINVTTAGSYTVRVTNANGCQSAASAPTAVTVNALPATPTITAGGPTTFCAGGSVTLTSSASLTYLWSTGATTATINVTTEGSYTVKVTNASGCQSAVSAATVVTVNALPATPTITAGGTTTFCAGGSVTLTSSAGSTYLWSTGATTSNINVTTAGNYTVKVTNASGCQSAVSVATIVTVNALPATPTITAGGPTTFCAGGSVTLTSSAGTSYIWSNGATSQNINVAAAGSFTVQVTNASGCQSAVSSATAVNVNALPVVNAGPDATIPNGTSTTLNATVTGTGPFTYSWSPSSQLVNALIEDPTTINLPVTTVFTLMATSTATSCSNTDAVTITISGGPLSSTPTATPGTICAGADVQLDAVASGSTGIYSYAWTSTPVGFTSSIANPIVNPTVNTTYYVAVNDGFSTVNTQVAVTVNALPATPTITAGGPTTFCAGGNVTLTSSAGTTYLWSTGATTASINITTTGSYTVQLTNASGCQSAVSATTIVTVNALPATPTITADGPTTFCAGGSVTLTSSAGSTYLWSNAATTQSINVTTSGSFTVQITNASGCQSAVSVATVVTVNALPATPTISADGPTTFCAGGSVTLTSSAGSTYLWSTGATTASINVTTTGSYTVQVTNASGCQSAASAATVVTVNALPVTPTITAGGLTTFCAGGNVSLTSSAGTSYLWSTGATTQSINVTAAGSYTVQVTNISGCQSAASATTIVTVNAFPATPTITADGPTTFCAGGSVALTSSTGASYLWSTGATTSNINVTTAGSYAVRVTNVSGCQSAASVATIVTVNALPVTPTIVPGGPTTFCTGDSITLTSSSGISYLWSDAETTESINITTSGSYTVKVMNVSGCQSAASAATVVTVNTLPVVKAINNGPVCAGSALNLTGGIAGMTTYYWTGPNGFTSLLQNPSVSANVTSAMAGVYTLAVINANGCTSTDTTEVTVNALPVATASNSGPVCEGSALNLTGGPAGMTTYSWTGPGGFISSSLSPSVSASTAAIMVGVYTLTVTNASGCTNTATTTVTVNALPVATANNNGPVCAGSALNLTGGASGMTTYSWTGSGGFTSNTQSPSVSASSTAVNTGVYNLIVTNASGCTSTATTTVTINALPLVNITSSSSSMCLNDLRTLTGSPAGGTFIISDGQGTLTGNVLSATGTGNIKLEYNYTNVCTNKATQSIIVNEKPFANAGTDQKLTFVFKTQMKAELSLPETGEWSVISGSGHISDIHSPTTIVTALLIGENIFLWKVRNGNCEDSAKVKITVYDLFVPSVITPDGNGKNDYFKISENIGQVELIIFNRWGIEEYTNSNYLNDWNGLNNKGTELPNDTYFYVMKFENGKIKKGSVLIKR